MFRTCQGTSGLYQRLKILQKDRTGGQHERGGGYELCCTNKGIIPEEYEGAGRLCGNEGQSWMLDAVYRLYC
jgi:hypothetical protein